MADEVAEAPAEKASCDETAAPARSSEPSPRRHTFSRDHRRRSRSRSGSGRRRRSVSRERRRRRSRSTSAGRRHRRRHGSRDRRRRSRSRSGSGSRERRRRRGSRHSSPSSPSRQRPGRSAPRQPAFARPASSAPPAPALSSPAQLLAARALAAQAAAALAGSNATRKQREVYVGNLTTGMVSAPLLADLFNRALSTLQPHPAPPAVVNVNMDSAGKFAFVEMRTEELATAALMLDKVSLCGRSLNVGRPKGYIDPATRGGIMPTAIAAPVAPAVTAPALVSRNLLLLNLVPCSALRDAGERAELLSDVAGECARHGAVEECLVPEPPTSVPATEPARVYVRFDDQQATAACAAAMHGRLFDGRRVAASTISEAEFARVQAGDWV